MLCTLWEPFCLFTTPSPLAHESREGVWGQRGPLLHRVKVQRGFCQSLEDVAFASCCFCYKGQSLQAPLLPLASSCYAL